jgi:NADH-quinone oxidoreductase subunit J
VTIVALLSVLVGTLLAVSLRSVLHAVFCLALSLAGVACLFLLLDSPFVATMQILVYVGGISVAMVFAVMMSRSPKASMQSERLGHRILGVSVAVPFFGVVGWILLHTDFAVAPERAEGAGSVVEIGRDLLTHYNLVFELLSLALLVAIMGAILLTSRDDSEEASE